MSLSLCPGQFARLSRPSLANCSSDGEISAAFQRDSSNARNARESGMTLIIGELNRHCNRGLLAQAKTGDDPDNYLWSTDEAATSYNPCRLNSKGRPDLAKLDSDNEPTTTADNTKIGFHTEAPYQTIYLNTQGYIVSNAASASKAYRLLWVRRQPLGDINGKQLLKIFQADGHGSFSMVVEGMALRNGEVASRINEEETFELTPKCCVFPSVAAMAISTMAMTLTGTESASPTD